MVNLCQTDLFKILFLFQCSNDVDVRRILSTSGIEDEEFVAEISQEYVSQRTTLLARYSVFKNTLESFAATEFPNQSLETLSKKQIVYLIHSLQETVPQFNEDLWFGVAINIADNNSVGAMARLFSDMLQTPPNELTTWMNDPAHALESMFS